MRDATQDELRDGFLFRLDRLLRLRRDHFDELNAEGLRLLDRSIFTTLCDLIDIGAREAATAILRALPLAAPPPRPPRRRRTAVHQ